MKKSRGFTLIELLIVTVVIVTLMAIVFRLAGSGGESTARAKTLARIQKLSNALSGYYAAFGSYPPVPLQGRSRDIYRRVDNENSKYPSLGYGIQSGDADDQYKGKLTDDSKHADYERMKRQIEAACRAQPLAAGFPYNPHDTEIKEIIDAVCAEHGLNYSLIDSDHGFNFDSSEWSKNNVFMFGLLSFLLPRYQFMLDGERNLYVGHHNGPWTTNNRLPYRLDGTRPKDWDEVQKALGRGPNNSNSDKPKDRFLIESLPSQAVCARWMPNFKNLVTSRPVITDTEFFGVDTRAPHDYGDGEGKWFVISQNGYGGRGTYIQGTKTVLDGWGEEFYYYSPPPYQSYQLWSSGPNKRTFPPWMEPEQKDREVVNKWIADDIKVGDK